MPAWFDRLFRKPLRPLPATTRAQAVKTVTLPQDAPWMAVRSKSSSIVPVPSRCTACRSSHGGRDFNPTPNPLPVDGEGT